MGHNDHIDFELADMVEAAVDAGYLEEGTPAYGVAQQAIDFGLDSLTPKQRWVFDHVLWAALRKHAEWLERREIRRLLSE
ncbi:hypothetical protein [Acuticoccus mangrovi]|uniref:Uncharacterized protein n=1 Tax=Acuticoccus mangrovi TaxID=2796142 RepID=A0A934ITR8_9HYPH|nr:hypothetical protein [Acuticoccus mangrovi]MBJ3777549.1 hypothetical protein [Acuticoccus mangrovi]